MRTRHLMAVTTAALAFACGQEPTRPPEPAAAPIRVLGSQTAALNQSEGERTPFQRSVMQAIAERQAQGLPVPASVSYTYKEESVAAPAPAPGAALRLQVAPPAPEKKITAQTVIEFTQPAEAGQDVWPDLVVRGEVPQGATGFVKQGDYTAYVKQKIAEQYPESNVPLESGPRTYTVTESLVATTPGEAPAPTALRDGVLSGVTSADDLLMGFTVLGPNIDYSIDYTLDICVFWFFGCVAEVELVDFWAGFKLDWTIGTRLPLALSVATMEAVKEGDTFSPTSAATGEDWSAADFQQAGVAPESGNEFILRFIFKVGVFIDVFGADVVDLGVDVDLDEASSFTTPLGAGAMFDLPTIDQPVWSKSIGIAAAEVGISLTPQAGSDKFTADWLVSGEGGGSGSVAYTTSGQPVSLGSLRALDGPGNATVQLSNFRYYFNQFGLDLGLYFYISVLGYGGTWTVPVTDFDLSALTGGLYIKPHSGTPGAIELKVPIENVAPTVTLSHAGTVVVDGTPTLLTRPGQVVGFSGEASDPGEDDLTLMWDWDDGAPSPDVSTTYPVPHQVTESQTHAFEHGCLYHVTLKAVDDDQAAGQDMLPVLVTGDVANRARLEGYWQNEFGRMGHRDFDDAGLECYLAIVNHFSAVAGEVWHSPDIQQAWSILWMQQNGGSPLAQFDRDLLVAWLNFAHGAIGYAEAVDANGDGKPDTPFAEAMRAAESVRLDGSATASQIRTYTRILHHISEMAVSERQRRLVDDLESGR